jgi:diguanylate cyclase (GGDEF)-like protein/PAS domain S-box-containing protein
LNGIRLDSYSVPDSDLIAVKTGTGVSADNPTKITRSALEAELSLLRHRETLFDASEHFAQIGHYEWDNALNCLKSCSRGYAEIFNMNLEQIIVADSSWDKVLQIIHPDDRERYEAAFAGEYLKSAFDINFRILLADDEVKHIREIGTGYTGRHNAEGVTFGILQDITSQVKRERDLEHRDEMARHAESITDIGHFIYDEANQKYLYISDGLARIYGTSVSAYMAATVSVEDDLSDIHIEDRERVASEYKYHLETGVECAIEYRIHRGDGEIRWLRELSSVHLSEDGQVMQTLGVVQDITDRVVYEKELVFKDALATQAESITDIGHFVYDEINEKYLFASEGLGQIFGLNPAELTTRVTSKVSEIDLLHLDDRVRVQKVYDDFLSMGDSWNVEFRLVRADGEVRWVREVGKAHVTNRGIPEQSVGVVQDITDQKLAEQEIIDARNTLEKQVHERTRELAATIKQLQQEIAEREKVSAELDFMANHDALTGLPSLRLCKDRLEHSLAEARRNKQVTAVMFLDLDGFKAVNDSLGHEFGDLVLKVIADRIKVEIRETDTVARIGGDEFIIILSSLPELGIVERIAGSLIAEISRPIQIENNSAAVGASIGIALYPENGESAQELMRSADRAMYQVKQSGKNNFAFA